MGVERHDAEPNCPLDKRCVSYGIGSSKKEGEQIWQVKVKTDEWLRKVKEKFGLAGLKEELNNDKTLIAEYEN